MKKIKILMYIYVLYRLLNLLIVSAVGLFDIQNSGSPENDYRYYLNFEYPAPYISDVIDYQSLSWSHRCFISENEFNSHDNYKSIMIKANLSFILLPWTMQIDLLTPSNDNYRHQYNEYGLDIDVWCEKNVFTGQTEEMFFFYDSTIIMLPVLILVFLFFILNDIKSLLSYIKKTDHSVIKQRL